MRPPSTGLSGRFTGQEGWAAALPVAAIGADGREGRSVAEDEAGGENGEAEAERDRQAEAERIARSSAGRSRERRRRWRRR